jgi:plasmid stability protein
MVAAARVLWRLADQQRSMIAQARALSAAVVLTEQAMVVDAAAVGALRQ